MGMWELIREKINLIDIEDDIIDSDGPFALRKVEAGSDGF